MQRGIILLPLLLMVSIIVFFLFHEAFSKSLMHCSGIQYDTEAVVSYTSIAPDARKYPSAWIEINSEKLDEIYITALSADNDYVWIGTWFDGLIVHDSEEENYVALIIDNNPIISLFARDEDCWFGLGDGRIGHTSLSSGEVEIYELGDTDKHSWFESITWFDKRFWFASPEEIISYNPKDKQWNKMDGFTLLQFDQWQSKMAIERVRDDYGRPLDTKDNDPDKKKNLDDLRGLVQSRLSEGKSIKDIFSGQLRFRGSRSLLPRRYITLRNAGDKMFIVSGDKLFALIENTIKVDVTKEHVLLSDAIALQNSLFVSTFDTGFFIKEGAEIRHIKRARVTSLWEMFNGGLGPWSEEDSIISMVSHQNMILMLTMKGRILEYNTSNGTISVRIRLYPYIDGLATAIAYHKGCLWIGTSVGLSQLNLTKDELNKEQWIRYTPKDTMPKLERLNERVIYATLCEFMGAPYYWGKNSPDGVDCSGLVMKAFNRLGFYMAHYSKSQHDNSEGTSKIKELRFGDLVFFNEPIDHVGIYLGEGHFVHSSGRAKGVGVSSLADSHYKLTGVKRVSMNSSYKGLIVKSDNVEVLESNLEDAKSIGILEKDEVVKPIAREGQRINIESSRLVTGWIKDDGVVTEESLNESDLEAQSSRIISSFSPPLLRPLTGKFKPFKIGKKIERGLLSFELDLSNHSELMQNNRIMIALLSKDSYSEDLRKSIIGETSRIEVLRSSEDLISAGLYGKQFEPFRSGVIAIFKAKTDKTMPDKANVIVKYRQSKVTCFIVQLRGAESGILYKVS